MATAEARYHNEKDGLKVVFFSRKYQRAFWEGQIFENNPRIEKHPVAGQKYVFIENIPGKRPYVKEITPERLIWNENFKAEPGEIFLKEGECPEIPEDAVIVEPNTKEREFNKNKAWDWDRWVELVSSVKANWVQLGPSDTKLLPGVTHIKTNSFRAAMGAVSKARLLVATDGGLHHAAAALGRPAVVLWGGLISPKILGYDSHTNIWSGVKSCGSITSCEHCKKAMDWITVDMVREAIGHY